MSKAQLKLRYIKLLLVGLSVGIIYLILIRKTTNTSLVSTTNNQTQPRAYIITADCSSIRFNATKHNIERAFPTYFKILCFLTIPLNDSRIHTASVELWKKWSSNLLAFVDIWTYEIPKYSNNNELEWSFIFEDDVNFCDPSTVSLPNFIAPLQEIMHNPEVQLKDGFLYLGICGPDFNNDSQPIISKNTNNSLISKKGYGFCLHATGITAKRAKMFWGEIASYRPNSGEKSLDYQVREYSMKSKNFFYTFGSNFHYPPGTGHYGVAFQDRGKFWSSIS